MNHTLKSLLLTAMLLTMAGTAFCQTAEDYVNDAIAKTAKGDVDGALADYNKAIELKPDYAFFYYGRGKLKQVKNDLQGALADFNKASEILPDDPSIQGKIDEVKAALAAAAPADVPQTNDISAQVTTNSTAPAAASPDDVIKIQGSWSRTSSAIGDAPLPSEFLKPLTYKFNDGRYEKTVNGGEPEKGTYSMDPSTNPGNLTMTATDGADAGRTILGIYELNGDTLRICVDPPGTNRPASFQSSSTTQHFIETYQRIP
jgi:uncharacterized protein (TIGR03067 family)